MKMLVNDHSQALPKLLIPAHENKWVAIAPDYSQVLAAADTLRDLLRTAPDTNAVLCKVLPRDVSFAPFATLGA
jgi:hypothetical protein